jgi:hypothetical protein
MSKQLIEKQVKNRVKGEARKKKQKPAKLNKDGAEVLDERPLFHDLGFKQPETMNDKIRRITQEVQAETVAKLAAQNMTEEDLQRILDEEDDFDIPDEYHDIMTTYEAAGLASELKEEAYLDIPPPESNEGAPAPSEGSQEPKAEASQTPIEQESA